ncbi:MAG: hypothetical protein H6686_06380 [Fibrobacteria bacterium]|nr:hypothetical protein [Fibrobacteria bacterium]
MAENFFRKVSRLTSKVTNGVLLIVIGGMHNQFALSSDGFQNQFAEFAKTNFFKISNGLDDLPLVEGVSRSDLFAAFWFFYFGLLLIPIGLLVHSIEIQKRPLPLSFTLSYLLVVGLGCYMVPNSGMTFIMLPHAVYMLIRNILRARSLKIQGLS